MFDVEYLQSPILPQGIMLYRYRTGCLRPAMTAAFGELSDRAGILATQMDGDELVDDWLKDSLFGSTVRVCHLADAALAKLQFSRLRALFGCAPSCPTIIMVRASKHNEGRYSGVMVIEEPLVVAKNIRDVLNYVAKVSKFKSAVLLRNERTFVEYFDDWIAYEEPTTLPRVFSEFTRAMLLNSAKGDLAFSVPSTLDRDPLERSFLARSLERFIDDRSRASIFAVLRAASIRKGRGLGDQALIEDLISVTHRLIRRRTEETGGVKATRAASTEVILLWGTLLLTWSAGLASSAADLGSARDVPPLLSLQNLLGKFAKRASNMSADPVEGQWENFKKVIADLDIEDSDDEGQQVKTELIRILVAESRRRAFVPWLAKLSRVLSANRIGANVKAVEVVARDLLVHNLNRFAEIVGQPNIAGEIRGRFAEGRHDRPLLLVGPAGSGKRTIARLYARALLCEGLRGSEQIDPCGSCVACRGAQTGSVWGYLELDMARSNIEEIARQQIAQLQYEPISERRVVILNGLDRSHEGTDAFLKTLENGTRLTTFIGVAEDESSVRSAALSRSDCFRVASLDRYEARALLERWTVRQFMEPQALDVIGLLGVGRPGLMLRHLSLAIGAEAWSLAAIRKLFELEGTERAICYLVALLSESADEAEALLQQIDDDPTRAVIAVQTVLYHALLGHVGSEPSLVGVGERLKSLGRFLEKAAERRGLKKHDLAMQLASHWRGGAALDLDSLLEVGREAQLIVSGASLLVTLPDIADLVH